MMKTKNTILSLAFAGLMCSGVLNAQPKVVAHRGYWDCEGSAQNSISSLRNAAKIGVYGSEFDVQMTSDLVAVVNHDAQINGLVIAETKYKDLKNQKLKNGEKISTLEQYLKEGRKHHEMQLILEIKIQPNEMMEKAAVDETVRLVKKLKMEKQINYISFSKYICDQLRAAFPYAEVAILSEKYDPTVTKEACLSGVDYSYKAFKKNPDWISQCREKGLNINVWTVDKPEMIQAFIDKDVDFITTNKPVLAKELVDKKFAK